MSERKILKVRKKPQIAHATIGGVTIEVLSHPGKGTIRRSVWDKAVSKVAATKKLTISGRV